MLLHIIDHFTQIFKQPSTSYSITRLISFTTSHLWTSLQRGTRADYWWSCTLSGQRPNLMHCIVAMPTRV